VFVNGHSGVFDLHWIPLRQQRRLQFPWRRSGDRQKNPTRRGTIRTTTPHAFAGVLHHSHSRCSHHGKYFSSLCIDGHVDETQWKPWQSSGSFSHWSMSHYHRLPEALLSDSLRRHQKTHSSPNGIDVGGKVNPTTKGAVTTLLQFHHKDLVRGMEDTINAENEAYRSSINPRCKTILSPNCHARGTATRTADADFCFLSPTHSPSNSATGASGAFAATSVLILVTDGTVRVASLVLFDGTILPGTMLVEA